MSYQIYYDRAYIRIGDKFIPLANSGSNNCFEHGFRGRWLSEKGWNVLNWTRSKQFIFSDEEIRDTARIYDEYNRESGMMFKSRNQCFAPGEMERWIINGMKRAYTVEEYVAFGNSFFVSDYSPNKSADWKKHSFSTTAELLKILDDLKDVAEVDIKLWNNREVYRPKSITGPRTKPHPDGLPEYFVLKGEYEGRTIYFLRFVRNGAIKFFWQHPHNGSKFFKTEKDALKYLDKYSGRFGKYGFIPERIINTA